MANLDDHIAQLGSSGGLLVVLAIALLLGLRHATDPDHLTAVSTLVAGQDRAAMRQAATLGLAWGAGHATTLLVFGMPVVLVQRRLPGLVTGLAELAIGVLIVGLALRLLLRQRHRRGHHGGGALGRSPLTAFGVGLVHGIGGSGGVGILLVGSAARPAIGGAALAVFAIATALSMAALSAGFGKVLARGRAAPRAEALFPMLGVLSLAFGAWYAAGAVHAVTLASG
jgi:hypothetical protein